MQLFCPRAWYYCKACHEDVKNENQIKKCKCKNCKYKSRKIKLVNINVPFLLNLCFCIQVGSCHSEYIKNFKNISGSFSHWGHDGPLCIKKSANWSTHHHRWKACSTKWRYNTYTILIHYYFVWMVYIIHYVC